MATPESMAEAIGQRADLTRAGQSRGRTMAGAHGAGLLLGLLVLLLCVGLGDSPIYTQNEAFYADAVRGIVARGDWTDLRYNDAPRLRKPPLLYWLSASSARLFGSGEFGLRLPVVLLAVLAIAATGALARELAGRAAMLPAALAMGYGLQFAVNARYLSPEVPLTAFFTAALAAFVLAERRGRERLVWLGWFLAALAGLIKGVQFTLLLIALQALWLGAERGWRRDRWRVALTAPRQVLGALAALALALSWYAWAYVVHGEQFIAVQGEEIGKRIGGAALAQYGWDDLGYYGGVALWGFMPYALAALGGLARALSDAAARAALALPLIWLALLWLVLTALPGKLPPYWLQAHAALAVLAGWWLSTTPRSSAERWLRQVALWLPALLALAVLGLLIAALDLHWAWLAGALLPFTLAAAFRSATLAPAAAMLALLAVLQFGAQPEVDALRDYRTLAARLAATPVPAPVPIHVVGEGMHNLPYYTGRRIVRVPASAAARAAEPASRPSPGVLVLLPLLPDASCAGAGLGSEVWRGTLYAGASESQYAKVLRAARERRRGRPSDFRDYALCWRAGAAAES